MTIEQMGQTLLTGVCLGILALGYWVWLPSRLPVWSPAPFVGLVLALTLGKRADAKLAAKYSGKENAQAPRWVRVARFVLGWLPTLFIAALCVETGKYAVKMPG